MLFIRYIRLQILISQFLITSETFNVVEMTKYYYGNVFSTALAYCPYYILRDITAFLELCRLLLHVYEKMTQMYSGISDSFHCIFPKLIKNDWYTKGIEVVFKFVVLAFWKSYFETKSNHSKLIAQIL